MSAGPSGNASVSLYPICVTVVGCKMLAGADQLGKKCQKGHAAKSLPRFPGHRKPATMNFYPVPPTIKAELFVRVPDHLRCLGKETEWRGGFARPFQHIFLEGPVADEDGNLFIVDVPYGRILKISPSKEINVAAQWDGEPNGLAVTHDGLFVVADYKQGILTFDPSLGTVKPLMARRHLERFKGPNDLIVDSKGTIYFTDQGQTGMTDQTGKVYRLLRDGRLDTLVENGVSPNGIVLSPDERFLFVAMTRSNQVWRLPLHPDGTTTKAGVFFQSFGNSGPDGLAMDEEGSLFVCHPSLGSVFVVDSDGVPKARIVTGTSGINLTNCCFGGPENKTIYITDSLEGNVQKVEWHCRGARPQPKVKKSGEGHTA